MKVVYTDEAIENLAAILDYTASHYPAVYDALLCIHHVAQDEP